MHHPKRTRWGVLALSLLAGRVGSSMDPIGKTGQEILTAHQESVATAIIILEMPYGGEDKVESAASFVHPSGLAVLALDVIDPFAAVGADLAARMGEDRMRVEVKDIKMRLHDGQEIPAEIALRDQDLGLVFIRPRPDLSHPVKSIDLSSMASPELLDQAICLNRLGQAGGWEPALSVLRIEAILKKPRTLYVHSHRSSLGCPVFALDGRVLGISLWRGGGGRGRYNASGPGGMGSFPMILPADQVLEVAQQAINGETEKTSP